LDDSKLFLTFEQLHQADATKNNTASTTLLYLKNLATVT